VTYVSHEAREKILRDYQTHLRGLDQIGPLSFLRMCDFDEKLNLKIPVHL
jgi:hypothetical protein